MSDAPFLLAGDFPAPTRRDWEAEVLKVMNRRAEGQELTLQQAMKQLSTITVDDLVIEPLYSEKASWRSSETDPEVGGSGEAPADWRPGPPALGHPGVSPFTRGSAVRTDATPAWDVTQLHEDGDVAFSNPAALADLARGATSLWLRLDPDAIAAADLAPVLDGVRPELAPLQVSSRTDQAAAAGALADLWRADGHGAEVRGSLGLDPLGHVARTGEPPDYAPLRHWVGVALAEFPQARTIAVDVLPYDDAGAGDVDLLAFAVATGVEYLRDLELVGIGPEVAFGQITFRVPTNADQFLTIARLRALRRLWARVGEVSGAPAPERGAVQWAVTSWRMFTRDDPWLNLLRSTIATFGAAAGGAASITVLPHDTVQGLPTDFSRRMARNVQLLAAEEANLGRVADPAGGSWYVERLTDQLAHRGWARFRDLEAAGGMARALAEGRVAESIGATVAVRDVRLADRSQPITGVSTFPSVDQLPLEVRPRPVADTPGGLQPHRDSELFEALRDRVASAAEAPTVFLACLGERRDFAPSQRFAANLLQVAGIQHRSCEGTAAELVQQVGAAGAVIMCSSADVHRSQAINAATALKQAGVSTVVIAGRLAGTGSEQADEVIDGEVFDGIDVPGFLSGLLDRLGVPRAGGAG